MRLFVFHHGLVITFLLVFWQAPVSNSAEVCCCPDFTLSLSLTADDPKKAKSLQNGFLFVTERGSDVSLQCELADKDHSAVEKVDYKFHKTYQLNTGTPISLSSQKKELCSDSTASTCALKDVQYTKNPDMEIYIDNGDNHIYQCSATITLKDGGEVILWSHTIKLDVYYPPVKGTDPATDTKTISEGKSMEKFECALPESNPMTKAQWSYRRLASDAWTVIDIPNDSRGQRLTIVEEKIEAGVTEGRGTLMLMIFTPTEDVGFYKCEGVYDTEFTVSADVFKIANYELRQTGHDDSGALQLKPISAITYPKLVGQDSAVNFTVYARDTPGRGKYEDVTYTWQMDNTNIDFDASPHLVLSNNDRTLTVNKLSDYVTNAFSCQMERPVTGDSPQTATSATMGFRNDDVVIAPKYLNIPLTSRTCVNIGDQLRAAPNKAFMMPTATLAGANPEQILLKADSFKYFINENGIFFISDDEKTNFDNDTGVGITEDEFKRRLPNRENDRCIYWQYMRSYGLHYQVIEVMKTYRMANDGCNTDGPPSDIFDGKVIASNDGGGIITVSFTETITTSLCLTISLVDSTGKVLDTKTLTDTVSDSTCSSRQLPEKVELDATKSENGGTGLVIKICRETSPDECFTKSVKVVKTCAVPDFQSPVKSVNPTNVAIGEKFTVKCIADHSPSHAKLLCKDDGTIDYQPKCEPDGEPIVDPDDKAQKDNKTEIIVGVVVGIVCVVVVLVIVFLLLRKRRTGKDTKGQSETEKKDGVTYKNTAAVNKDAKKQEPQNKSIPLADVKKENQDEEAEYEIPDSDKKSNDINGV